MTKEDLILKTEKKLILAKESEHHYMTEWGKHGAAVRIAVISDILEDIKNLSGETVKPVNECDSDEVIRGTVCACCGKSSCNGDC